MAQGNPEKATMEHVLKHLLETLIFISRVPEK